MTSSHAAARSETRLALVLNGGVSLAVWMGGVTHEIELLRRASRGETEGVSEADLPVLRIWERLAADARTQLSIDIIAGTSAGGLNGMLLATALARNAPLPDLRTLWEESAALAKLLDPPARMSVLNGETFRREIHGAVARIGAARGNGQPVTLFLTSTALDGPNRVCKDGFGNEFEVRDHRRLYHFHHGERIAYARTDGQDWRFAADVRSDFRGDENTAALVQAARATAGFPVAFPATGEDPLLRFRVLPGPELSSATDPLMDGGVLNNAPFGPVLEAITRRKLDRPVRRVVVYVVPSAGRAEQGSGVGRAPRQVPWLAAAQSALSYPGEANFRSAADDLTARLRNNIRDVQLELFERMVKSERLTLHVVKTADALLPEYRRNRALAVIEEVRRRVTEANAAGSLVAPPQADSAGIDAILGRHAADGWTEPNWTPRWDAGEEVHGPWTQWRWGLAAAQRILELFAGHLHAHAAAPFGMPAADTDPPGVSTDPHDGPTEPHGVLTQPRGVPTEPPGAVTEPPLAKGGPIPKSWAAADPRTPDQQAVLLHAAEAMSARVLKVLALVDAFHAEVDQERSTEVSDEEAAALLQNTFALLNIPAVVAGLVTEAGDQYAEAMREAGLGAGWDGRESITAAIAMELLTRVYSSSGRIVEPSSPTFEFLRLGPDRISPLFDAGEFAPQRDRKLYGIRLMHFGAFADKEWRKSDFAWGRLDAALHLLDLLGVDDEEEQKALHRAILDAEIRKESPTAADGAPVPPQDPQAWMRGHLRFLKKMDKDRALLEDFARTAQGRVAVKGVAEAVVRLLEETGRDATGQPPAKGPVKALRTLLSYGRTVFVRKENRAGLAPREKRPPLRLITLYLRHRFWQAADTDPLTAPKALADATKRTAVVIGVLAVLGALALLTGIGFALGALADAVTG